MQSNNKVCRKYVVWSQKYRPANMSELIGQEVLTKILNYSMISQTLSHAYLLSGIQGIGKTTAARIISKTINCTHPSINSESIIACEECNSCSSFNKRNHPDINEIDAASNTGVDSIREIIEDSEYMPLLGKYKVFIIDEVHMLSKSAFNALLKLLEEPPRYTIFIFATTEINKIPLTVISRCQRFNLRRLDHTDIKSILGNIASKEGIKITSDALELIAIKSDGAARDAISLLEQAYILSLASYTKENTGAKSIQIDFAIVEAMCRNTNLPIIVELLSAIVEQNLNTSMDIINNIYQEGGNFVCYSESIIDLIGCIIKLKAIDQYQDPTYANYISTLNAINAKVNIARLTVLWQIFNKTILELRTTHNAKLSFEVNVIKAIYSFSLPTPSEALKKIQRYNSIDITNNNNANAQVIGTTITSSYVDYNNDAKETTSTNTSNSLIPLVGFLAYLQQIKEVDLYYYLMNKISVIKIEGSNVYLSSNNSDRFLNTQLEKHLKKWKDANWKILTLADSNQVPFKSKLLEHFKSSEEWRLVTEKFNDAQISDIVINVD